MDFYWEYYRELNPDLGKVGLTTPNDFNQHFFKYGRRENRKYKFSELYPEFNYIDYIKIYPNLQLTNKADCEYHYFSIGRHNNYFQNYTKMLDNINIQEFIDNNKQLEYIGIKNIEDVKKYYKTIHTKDPELVKNIKKPTFGVFITGFGMPNIEIKLQILQKNLQILAKWKDKYEISLYIYMYSVQFDGIFDDIDFSKYISKAEIILKPGIVGEFIYNDVSTVYNQYEYVILFLDDIELQDSFDLDKLLMVYNLEQLDILGLPLTIDSPCNYKFMLQQLDIFNYRETNFVEFFFYFISSKNFPKYLRFYSADIRWCWGIDLALGNYNMKLGILDLCPIKHYFKAISYNRNLPSPHIEIENTKKKFRYIQNKIILKKEKH
jgi:hypothetical protein